MIFRQIFKHILASKLRTFLAMFSIMWGTLIVVILMSFAKSYAETNQKEMINLADGTFFVMTGRTSKSFGGFPAGYRLNIKAKDVFEFKDAVPGIDLISPSVAKRSYIKVGDKKIYKLIFGVGLDYFKLRKVDLTAKSRGLNYLDYQNNEYVCIIGDKIKNLVFGKHEALNHQIQINGIYFTVVGVVNSKSDYDFNKDSVLIPYNVFKHIFGDISVRFFQMTPKKGYEPSKVARDFRAYLSNRYHFAPDDDNAINFIDTTELMQFLEYFFLGVQIFLGLCGALTLAVGGLGVANIMFLIVNERTREIGLFKALGAKESNIIWQIMLECLLIVFIGSFFGFLFSYLIIYFASLMHLPSWLGIPEFSYSVFLIVVCILIVLAFLAGFFPARKAAKMDPVVALGF